MIESAPLHTDSPATALSEEALPGPLGVTCSPELRKQDSGRHGQDEGLRIPLAVSRGLLEDSGPKVCKEGCCQQQPGW